jgi:hypothetical protein
MRNFYHEIYLIVFGLVYAVACWRDGRDGAA